MRGLSKVSILLLLPLLGACNRSEPLDTTRDKSAPALRQEAEAPSRATTPEDRFDDDSYRPASARPTEPAAKGEGKRGADREVDTAAEPQRRLVIYTAFLTLVVDAVQTTLAAADKVTVELGGHIAASTLTSRVLRIPSARYAEALQRLQELGTVKSLSQSAQDVTEAYADLVRRLENLRALDARYRSLLAATTDVAERLRIERELRRIGQELRELEDQQVVLADRIAFATIELYVEPKPEPEPVSRGRVQPFPWVDDYGMGTLYAGSAS